LKASDFLIISEESRLRKKYKDLSERTERNDYIIKGQLAEREREKELVHLQRQNSIHAGTISSISDELMKMRIEIANLKKNSISQNTS